jgi:ankyrin repeat protein
MDDVQTMQQLFRKGARATAWGDEDQNKALVAAVLGRRTPAIAAVVLLLEHGVKLPTNTYFQGDLLQGAMKDGHRQLVKRLLKGGVNVEHTETTDYCTALSWAAEMGSIEIVRDLLDYGANMEAVDKWGQTPLFFTVGNIEAVRLLLYARANPGAKDIH